MKYIAIFACALALSGCNTFRGLGEDIEAGGAAISEAANERQQEIDRRAAPQPVYPSRPPQQRVYRSYPPSQPLQPRPYYY